MNLTQWILAAWIALSALVVFGRGCAGSTRHYGMTDGIFALIECGVAIWLVASL